MGENEIREDEDFGTRIERLIDEGSEDWEIADAIQEADEVELLVALTRVNREKEKEAGDIAGMCAFVGEDGRTYRVFVEAVITPVDAADADDLLEQAREEGILFTGICPDCRRHDDECSCAEDE
jgi:hypothetical protein